GAGRVAGVVGDRGVDRVAGRIGERGERGRRDGGRPGAARNGRAVVVAVEAHGDGPDRKGVGGGAGGRRGRAGLGGVEDVVAGGRADLACGALGGVDRVAGAGRVAGVVGDRGVDRVAGRIGERGDRGRRDGGRPGAARNGRAVVVAVEAHGDG